MTPRQYAAAAILVGVAVVSAGTAWTVQGWRKAGEIATLKQQHAEAVSVAAKASADELTRVTSQRDALQLQLSTIAGSATAALTKAQNENDSMRDCVRRGTCGVRIAATCPTNPPGLPASASGGGVDSGTAAVLTPQAGQDYFSLRAGIIKTEGVLAACQASLRATLATPAPAKP